MLVFLDESGDTGLRLGAGSSEYFTVVLVLFEELNEANDADERINLLRREMGMPGTFEFHFFENSDVVRDAFFDAVSPYNFFYFGFVINKARLYGEGFKFKDTFYRYVCRLIFENAKPHLENAIVKIDGCGDRDFQRQLATYLKRKINDPNAGIKHIKKVSTPDSRGNNLLQLADMVLWSGGEILPNGKVRSAAVAKKDKAPRTIRAILARIRCTCSLALSGTLIHIGDSSGAGQFQATFYQATANLSITMRGALQPPEPGNHEPFELSR